MAKEGSPEFKSFRDLLRHRGGAPTPDEAPEGGWTLDSGVARAPADDDHGADGPPAAATRAATPADGHARERIAARPFAFGAMEHGPPVYADPDSEEMQLLAAFRVRTVFPSDVAREVADLPADPDPADWQDRMDLRGETIFTIDGEDAKDFDDAIGIRCLPDGNVEIGVHIADVAHYVRAGTALDAEALARGTSVYLPDQVVPMLPENLSNGLCSLVPRRPRLAYSVVMVFDGGGRRVDARVGKSVIRSVYRNTYRAVQALLDGEDTEETRAIRFLEEPLRLFEAWTKRQRSCATRRARCGSSRRNASSSSTPTTRSRRSSTRRATSRRP
jgi:hypothetical protein